MASLEQRLEEAKVAFPVGYRISELEQPSSIAERLESKEKIRRISDHIIVDDEVVVVLEVREELPTHAYVSEVKVAFETLIGTGVKTADGRLRNANKDEDNAPNDGVVNVGNMVVHTNGETAKVVGEIDDNY